MTIEERIAEGLKIDPEYVRAISKRNNMYVKYWVKGREILQPSQELKLIQKWLNINVFVNYPISSFSMAYSKGDSIKKNAFYHEVSRYLLHVDIRHFFPSITREMLCDFFYNNKDITYQIGLSVEDINLILDLCLYKGENLVIGSPASPSISNILMYGFDNAINETLCEKGDFKYSRYADDIVVSSMSYIPKDILDDIYAIIGKFGFTVNKGKTHFMNKSGKRCVTGVVLDNNGDTLSIGRKKYREIQHKLYKYLVKEEGDLPFLLGYLSYIKDININQYFQLEKTYKRYDKKDIIFK